MASRKVPLSNNPNAANSPIRSGQSLLSKSARAHSRLADRDHYQQPPAKKQALNDGRQRYLTNRDASQGVEQRPRINSYEAKLARERSRTSAEKASLATAQKYTAEELTSLKQWKEHHRAKFPKFVFYFEKVPEPDRYKTVKQLALLGAREEKFFSNQITHVITTRPIPPPDASKNDSSAHAGQDQAYTINPSLLNRSSADCVHASRKHSPLDATSSRRTQHCAPCVTLQDDRKPKARNIDVLLRSREMNKKIWSLEKFQRVLNLLVDDESRSGGYQCGASAQKQAEEPNLLQLLQNERINGPADRDPTAAGKELHFFIGPYIYIYDMNEKQKPIMVREYKKVADKTAGEWPQFRSVAGGRCPFVDDGDRDVRVVEKDQAMKPVKVQEARSLAKAVTGKRTLAEMEDGQKRGRPARTVFQAPKLALHSRDLKQNAFTSRATAPRLLAGEPVASGLQQSKITSAIKSQMISSTTGALGAKAGTSKEVQGLQRAVLRRHGGAVSQEVSAQPGAERRSQEENTSTQAQSSFSHCRQKLDRIEERPLSNTQKSKPRSQAVAAKLRKPDPKPGYCENCLDKFDDFDEHVLSRKHRRFAENDKNWVALDDLLAQLERPLKRPAERRSFSSG